VSKVFEICHQNLNSVRFLVNSNLTARVTTATNAAKGHVAVEHHFSEHQCYVCANSDQAGELTAERLKKKQEEMMAKAMADAQAAEDEADAALTNFNA
jgi:hypothetical protein